MKKQLLIGVACACMYLSKAQTNVFPANGNVGIGTVLPAAKLSFVNVDQTNEPIGICWYNDSPLQYSIHRTTGAWAPPNYQQLRMAWATGIVLDPASDGNLYSPSYVEVKGKGMRISSGAVGIGPGIINPPEGYLLAVGGKAILEEVKVKLQSSGWPDYVFKPQYQLMPLSQVEDFIKKKGHLPEVPSAKEVAKEGVELGTNQALLLRKIEELTLHLIQMEKRNNEQDKEIQHLKNKLQSK
ncbi:hypothetical protein ACTJIJ_22395 [Niabella sp. 22666]|uniref:hypothetical protein n=1 Tax=Niabella sp. 22666 TaxID=3453954 RepID=UPI003F8770AC